jgi:hypothetical protein
VDGASLQVASSCNGNVVLYGENPAGILKSSKLSDAVSTQRLVNEVARLQSLQHLQGEVVPRLIGAGVDRQVCTVPILPWALLSFLPNDSKHRPLCLAIKAARGACHST